MEGELGICCKAILEATTLWIDPLGSSSVWTEVLQQATMELEVGPLWGTASLELSLGLVTQLLLPPRTGESN